MARQCEEESCLGAVLNRKVVVVFGRVSARTQPEVLLFVLKELQFNFNWDVAQGGNEEIRESSKN